MKNRVLSILLLLFVKISVTASDIDIVGQWSCVFNEAEKSLVFNSGADGKIYNNSLTNSGLLKIDIWFTTTPYSGGTITGYRNTVAITSSGIPGVAALESQALSNTATNIPETGEFNVVVTVSEEIDGTFYIVDYDNFSSKITFNDQNNAFYYVNITASTKNVEGTVSIDDVEWEKLCDADNDNYYTYGILKIDADITSNYYTTVIAKLYYKKNTESDYSLYSTSSPFSIIGVSSDDYVQFDVDSLPFDIYDFKVEICDLRGNILVSYNEADDSSLDDYSFEISESVTVSAKVFETSWGTLYDPDYNDYTESRILLFDVDATKNVKIDVYAIISYKLSSSDAYIVYDTTAEFKVISDMTTDKQYFQITNLPHGLYDFQIEVYNLDDELLNTYNASNNTILEEQAFENSNPVINFTAYIPTDSYFHGGIDKDNDGYNNSRTLHFDVNNAFGETVEVFAKIYYKLSTESVFDLYKTTSNFLIFYENPFDAQDIIVEDLDSAKYDFQIEIYSASGTLLNTYTHSNLTDLKFEIDAAPLPLTTKVKSVYWYNEVDEDDDDYTASRSLEIDIDITSYHSSANVYYKLYYKTSASSNYSLMYTSSSITLTGESTDDAVLRPISNLAYNSYDFKIEVYDTDNNLLCTYTDADSPYLDNQKFESSEIITNVIEIYSTNWDPGAAIDADEDSYFSSQTLFVDVNNYTTSTVYLKLFYKRTNSSSYTLYETTPVFTITGSSPSDVRTFVIKNLAHGSYDFQIELYDSNNELLETYSKSDDNDLYAVNFENEGSNSSTIYVASTTWTLVIDTDEDLYTTSRTLKIDIENASSNRVNVYAVVYYKSIYTNIFSVYKTSQAISLRGDSGSGVINVPVSGLEWGLYDFKVEIYDDSNTLLDTYTEANDIELADQSFEKGTNVSVDELSLNFTLYPNPASEYVTVQSNSNEGTICITDISGKVVYRAAFSGNKSVIPVDGMNGTYTVTLLSNGTVVSQNLIVK